MKDATIIWFRKDLRLQDNPAVRAAARRGAPVIAVFIQSDEEDGAWAPGGASRWWLHHALAFCSSNWRARAGLAHGQRAGVARPAGAEPKQTGAGAVYLEPLL